MRELPPLLCTYVFLCGGRWLFEGCCLRGRAAPYVFPSSVGKRTAIPRVLFPTGALSVSETVGPLSLRFYSLFNCPGAPDDLDWGGLKEQRLWASGCARRRETERETWIRHGVEKGIMPPHPLPPPPAQKQKQRACTGTLPPQRTGAPCPAPILAQGRRRRRERVREASTHVPIQRAHKQDMQRPWGSSSLPPYQKTCSTSSTPYWQWGHVRSCPEPLLPPPRLLGKPVGPILS